MEFHLPAHIKMCWEEFNFVFAHWTGCSDGEGVERGWSTLNGLQTALKEMGPGAWRDTLEVHIGDMDWKKVVSLHKLFNFMNLISYNLS